MRINGLNLYIVCCVGLIVPTFGYAAKTTNKFEQATADQIVAHCAHQTIENDLSATMTIINRHRNGAEKKSVYKRFVKNTKGKKRILEKMLLVSEYPPEAVGMAFLRWEYTAKAGKYPDQWLYSPSLRKVRKISVRDEEERFLGSTLTLGDIAIRPVESDKHQRLGYKGKDNLHRFQVESTPKQEGEAYSKRVTVYMLDDGWESCRVEKMEYFGKKGLLQKTQTNQWQKVDDAWVWKHVDVENFQTKEKSTFMLEDVKVNVGLDDDIFSERKLRRVSKKLLK